MPEYTSAAIRQTGEIRDALGRTIAVGSDCDSVAIAIPGLGIIHLDARQRPEFERAYFWAEGLAEAWATEHGEAS